nr:GDSL-type esterase/lipase family protein [uncultured Chryseobacterium sp.]
MAVNNINAQQVTINVSDAILPENNATIDKGSLVGNAVSKEQLDTKLTSFKDEIQGMVSTNFKGTLKPTDTAPTEDGTYRPELSSDDDKTMSPTDWGTKYPNAGNLRAKKGYDTYFYKKGANWTKTETQLQGGKSAYQIWLDQGNTGSEQDFLNSFNGFSQSKFDQEAKKYIKYELISKDLSSTSMPNIINAGDGNSIFTTVLSSDKKITKLKIKVATSGLAKFTAKRGSSLIVIAANVGVGPGWNDILVNFDGLQGDFIGYSTKDSTANLYFGDNTGGTYYDINGGSHDGNIAVEVYEAKSTVNSFEDLAKANLSGGDAETFGVSVFNAVSKVSRPNLRNLDYGVVSAFNLPTGADVMGNNRLNISAGSVAGNFPYNSYAWSFGFIVNMPNMYTTTKNIATFNLGSYSLNIVAGGAGIACTIGSQSNGISYNYGNKKLKIEVIADARFLNVIVDGQRIGFLNVGQKASQFNFVLNTLDNKSYENIAFWNRDISIERAIQWGLDTNPFVLQGIQDKLFPSVGYQISDHLLKDNQYFDIPAEQSILKFKGKYFLYYTVAKSTPTAFLDGGVGVAISNRPDGGFMPYTGDAVIGGNRGKAGVNRAMASWAAVVGDSVYIFAAMDYTVTGAGGKIFKSSNGLDFTLVGNFIPTGIPYLANISIFPEKQSNGYYYGVVEGKPGASWASYLVRSQNFESGWEVVQTLPSLAVNANGMYGGPELTRSANNDRWMLFYHSAYELNGNAPTAIFYAESAELEPKNWIKKGKVLDINDELEYYSAYNVDQVATPQIFEENGKTYLSIVYAQNEPTLHCQIRVFKLDMTKEELVGMVPLEYDKNPMNISLGSKFSNSSTSKSKPDLPLFTKVIASGTSITNGVGSDGGSGIDASKAWRTILQNTLTNVNGRAITVVNGGVNGQSTSGMKTNLPSLLSGNTGQVVILEGAINDAQTAGVGIPVSATIANLSSMIDTVIASGNIPVLTTPMPINLEVTEVAAAYTNQKRSDLAFAVRTLAKNKNVRLIDLDKLANNDTTLLVDGLHPNPKGHLYMANAISTELV